MAGVAFTTSTQHPGDTHRRTLRKAWLACPQHADPGLEYRVGVTLDGMSTVDQTLASRLHDEAVLAAQDEQWQPLLDQLAAAAKGRDDLSAEVAGQLAEMWFAHPGARIGHELIAAGLLILAGVTDPGAVAKAVRVGYERGKGTRHGYEPTDATD
jgi:hypothetical protein